MVFKWVDEKEETPDFTHKALDQENEIKVSCNADNPGCAKRGTKEIKLCWDIMNEMIYSDGVFLWQNKKYFLIECTICNNYYIIEEKQINFTCEDCR